MLNEITVLCRVKPGMHANYSGTKVIQLYIELSCLSFWLSHVYQQMPYFAKDTVLQIMITVMLS